MEKGFKLKIITCENLVFEELVESFNTRSEFGKIQFYSYHTDTIISTVPAISNITLQDGSNRDIFINKGLLNFDGKENVLNICADVAIFKEDIDVEELIRDKEHFEKVLEDPENKHFQKAKRRLPIINMLIEFTSE